MKNFYKKKISPQASMNNNYQVLFWSHYLVTAGPNFRVLADMPRMLMMQLAVVLAVAVASAVVLIHLIVVAHRTVAAALTKAPIGSESFLTRRQLRHVYLPLKRLLWRTDIIVVALAYSSIQGLLCHHLRCIFSGFLSRLRNLFIGTIIVLHRFKTHSFDTFDPFVFTTGGPWCCLVLLCCNNDTFPVT
jgi:hypothetical protein